VSARPGERFAPVAPELFVRDVDASIRFYEDALGFEVWRREEHDGSADFAVLVRGDAHFLLQHERLATGGAPAGHRGAGIDIRVMVDDVDRVYERASAAGAQIARPIGDRDYGLRDFKVHDPDGFVIRFAQPLAVHRD